MNHIESVKARGICTVQPLVNGEPVKGDIEQYLSDESKRALEQKGKEGLSRQVKSNLVVNSGRKKLARILGGAASGHFVDRLVLGDLDGKSKSEYYPNLSDTGLEGHLTDLNGNVLGPIDLDPDTERLYPEALARYPTDPQVQWGGTASVEVDGNGNTILEDTSLDSSTNFETLGVQVFDQVTLNSNTLNPLVLGIRKIPTTDTLELHNPRQYQTPTGQEVQYRVDRPETMLLVSKLIRGNDFDSASWGPLTMVHEAGLLFNSDDLFNRVVFAPTQDNAGMLLQPDSISGAELSLRFEWVVVF